MAIAEDPASVLEQFVHDGEEPLNAQVMAIINILSSG